MFHPRSQPLERGWVGRVEGERVVHLAAQTLQSFFLGGGGAREHAEYPLDEVTLLTPVQHPPTVRVFDDEERFAFANASAVVGTGVPVARPDAHLDGIPRLAAVVGADGAIGGFTLFLQWRAPALPEPKRDDFALVLGPLVVTPDELDPAAVAIAVRRDGVDLPVAGADAFDWEAARRLAERGTSLRPGDVLAGPAVGAAPDAAELVELEADRIGSLACPVGAAR
jgi:hypothetical protein